MMRKLLILGAVAGLGLLPGCSDDDEFRLSEDDLTRKDWYYNNSRDQFGYGIEKDVVEVLYFSANHDVMEKEFAGRQTTRRGTWSADENNLIMNWEDERENWRVLDCNKNTLSVIGWGAREYTSDENLRSLTGDAYWVNEFNGTAGSEGFTTRLGFSLAGNKNVRDAYVLLSDTEEGRVKLEKSGEAWGGKIESNSIIAITFDIYDGDVARSRISFDSSSGSPLVPLGVDIGTTSTQVTYNVYYWTTQQLTTNQIMNHYLDIWIPANSCMRMIGGVNYMKLNTNVNVDVDTSSIVNAVNNLNNTTTSLSTKIDAIDSALNGNNQKLDDLIAASNANSQAQIDAINEQTQQQQDQYEDEKQEESQREDEMDDQASQAEGIFTFDLTNPFSGLFGLFTNSNCVSIPTLAGLVGSNETTYCSWFSPSVRSILTPAIGIVSTMIIFGFIVRWLSGSNTIEIGGK